MRSFFVSQSFTFKGNSSKAEVMRDLYQPKRCNQNTITTGQALLGSIAFAAEHDKSFFISRSKQSPTFNGLHTPTIVRFIDKLVTSGFVELVKLGNQSAALISEYRVTRAFKDWIVAKQIEWQIAQGHNFTYWKDSKDRRHVVKRKNTPARTHNIKVMENKAVFDYTTDDGKRGKHYPYVQQIFIGSKLDKLGRFYPLGSTLSKAERSRCTYQGQRTIEIDYTSLHFAILYHFEGLRLDSDPYQIDGFTRKVNKVLALNLINCSSERGFLSGVRASQRANGKTYRTPIKGEFDRNGKQKYLSHETWGWNGTESILKGVDVSLWLDKFKSQHKAIQGHFHSEDLSLRLQRYDSVMMEMILDELDKLPYYVPAILVHDSVRVPAQHAPELQVIMDKVSRQYLGYTAPTKKTY